MLQPITHLVTHPYSAFAGDPIYKLLHRPMICLSCRGRCLCEGYADKALLYVCPTCQAIAWDVIGYEPLFAAPLLIQATHRHYEIPCPYCEASAGMVGGNSREGLFFVCQKRCHLDYTRTIRRF